MTVLYEDNHLIAVNKTCSEIVQGDKTGDEPLSETIKKYLKEKYDKPGEVFLGVTHRLDRPVSGVVLFAKTSKALTRLNEMFKNQEIKKTYWAIVKNKPEPLEGRLEHFLLRNEKQNKSTAHIKMVTNAKKAALSYKLIAGSDSYFLLEVHLETGRHHQIRCQLAKMGCPTAAIQRKYIEEPYFEYVINEDLCIGCAKCVKGCTSFGNGSLHLQINHQLCLNCNECSIARLCPSEAISRVKASNSYKIKGSFTK